MTCLTNENMSICGNYADFVKERPDDVEMAYKIIVPYPFKFRTKLGKVECDCAEVEERYQPWYGTSWYHLESCAIMKHIKRYPGIQNLVEVDRLIAQTE